MRKQLVWAVLSALSLCAALPAWAWGNRGHQIVALVAYQHLTPRAQAAVDSILGDNETIDEISTLPDELRNSRPETKPWHFVDIPKAAPAYDAARDCQNDDCAVVRITRFEEVLGNGNASADDRFEALAFVVHFIGDLHQPLHSATGTLANGSSDRGGNLIKVRFMGKPANLHQVLDSRLIDQAGLPDNSDYVAHLEDDLLADAPLANFTRGTPVDWANEAHKEAADHIFKIPASKTLGQSYIDKTLPIVDRQLLRAGLRLASELNRILD